MGAKLLPPGVAARIKWDNVQTLLIGHVPQSLYYLVSLTANHLVVWR